MIWMGTMPNILKIWLRYEACLNDLNGYNAKYIVNDLNGYNAKYIEDMTDEACLNDLNGYNAKYIEDITEVWNLFKWSELVQCQIYWSYDWGMSLFKWSKWI